MPFGDFERRMTVARLERGDLVIFSAIALDEVAMRALEAFGRPAFLIVPNEIHRLDIKPWKDRYPHLTVVAPAGGRDKVQEVLPVDVTAIDFDDPRVQLVTVPGTDQKELALLVASEHGTSLVVNELIFNADDRPGVGGWLMHLLGVRGGGPHIPGVVKMREVKDKAALAAQLSSWAHLPTLRRLVVSHGNVIEDDVANVLQRIAQELAA